MTFDIVIIGAGAAGLAAAVFAGEAAARRSTRLSILLLEGAKKPGAKILVSGGGRCNVTNREVRPQDFNGGPQPLIRSVLRAFDHSAAINWMRALGVELKLEPTGKYFPVSDKARTVLDALMQRVEEVGVELRAGQRVRGIDCSAANATGERDEEAREPGAFEEERPPRIQGSFRILLESGEELTAKRIIVATGGMALPKSGSDGAGLNWLRRMGHTTVPLVPALCPLLLAETQATEGARRLRDLSGVTIQARLRLTNASGKRLWETVDSLLFTHFGLSGPAAMNLSRHWARARIEDPEVAPLVALGHPDLATAEAADGWLRERAARVPHQPVAQALRELWPERLATLLAAGVADKSLGRLTREERKALARDLDGLLLRVEDVRGWAFAETTAGGVDLREVNVRTMESRIIPGLFLCGEILDVDGRIGGFNFQWAWATGYLAGRGAVSSL